MASIFKKIGNFLNRDEVRAGLALGSALGGFGAFDGMKYGDTAKSVLGGLNLASGLRAGGASGALQAGLGGYGLAQGLGKVGTFGNTFDTLMGKKTAKPMYTNMGPPRSFASPNVKKSALPPFSESARSAFDEETGGLFVPTGDVSSQKPLRDMSIDGGLYAANNRVVNNAANNLYNNTAGQMAPSGQSSVANLPTAMTMNNADAIANINTAGSGGVGFNRDIGVDQGVLSGLTNMKGQDIYPPLSSNLNVGTGNNNQNDGSQTFKGFSFEKVMDNIVNKAMQDPLQAVAVGSALVTAFADDPKEEAAKQYAAEMARVRAQTDPNSDFGQNYMSSFSQRREKELDDAYTKATSDFVSTMSKRGMMDSTIFTEGKASLDAKFAELKAKIPFDAQLALQDYQKAQLSNINIGSQAAYRGGALNAGITNPFSNSFKAAVASTKS
tara:strand:+ start:196 stop:1518 length:1323 start_codon:yes stop_codon:yes gene_type:complete